MRFAFPIFILVLIGCEGSEAPAPSKRAFKPTPITDRKPRFQTPPEVKPILNGVEFALYAGEAGKWLELPSLSFVELDNNARYARFRRTVREMYGADFCDVNVFDANLPNCLSQLGHLERWLLRAGMYGSPTLLCEGTPSESLIHELRAVLKRAQVQKVTVRLMIREEGRWSKLSDTAKLVHLGDAGTRLTPGLEIVMPSTSISAAVDSFAAAVPTGRDFEVGPVQVSFERRAEVINLITNAARGRWPGLTRITLVSGRFGQKTWRTIPEGSELSYLNTQAFGLR